ncbi:hypothetical protein EDB19DRAFT_2040793 [Suillus lakei]|nr:hypothetical protein EDB19DRAFT_2040793 [Suillus lakei]
MQWVSEHGRMFGIRICESPFVIPRSFCSARLVRKHICLLSSLCVRSAHAHHLTSTRSCSLLRAPMRSPTGKEGGEQYLMVWDVNELVKDINSRTSLPPSGPLSIEHAAHREAKIKQWFSDLLLAFWAFHGCSPSRGAEGRARIQSL